MKNKIKCIMFISFLLLFISVNLSLEVMSDSKDKVAIVCFLEGEAWIFESTGKNPRKIELYDWINIGATLKTNLETKVILAFSTGDRYELGGKAKAIVTQRMMKSLTGSVKKLDPVPVLPQIVSISQKSSPGTKLGGIRLRSSKRYISGLYPSSGATILADEAIIYFEALEGVEKYRVEIEDEQGNNILSVETASNEVVVSPGVVKPGANYYWQVRTVEKTKPYAVSYAAFATISEENALIRNAFKRKVYQSKDGANHLLLAHLDMALGLKREACITLKKALALYPENKEIINILSKTGCKHFFKN